ncbi:MAG: DNA-formamidopyrimidine glycosylase family protein [Pseudomonadota bacterium]
MPEIPDLEVYVDHFERRLAGQPLRALRIANPFVLRTATVPPDTFVGRAFQRMHRVAKQLVFDFGDHHYLVVHLMISGRFQWRDEQGAQRKPIPKRLGLLALDFDVGTLLMTEASSKKRASLKLFVGADTLASIDPGGLEVLTADYPSFAERLRATNHTVKRALTDQRVFAGIGNAYSDEILHRARLSPFKTVAQLSDDEAERLFAATVGILREWTERLTAENGERFPKKVTAFHDAMAVHGRYKQPCPECGAPVQRIQYAENEANYCARCQTGGKVLADRSLSRLLKDNWPTRIEELE